MGLFWSRILDDGNYNKFIPSNVKNNYNSDANRGEEWEDMDIIGDIYFGYSMSAIWLVIHDPWYHGKP